MLARVREWIADDPDPGDARELRELLTQVTGADRSGALRALQTLREAFAGSLQFGTAGLRGELGAGPNRMNRAVVIRAAAGVMTYLNERVPHLPKVVVGYDARHRSEIFASETAAVVAGAGGHALVLPGPVPTPLLAFAVRHLGADAGVMVTASHNPPRDNGYKVYLGGRLTDDSGTGVQIVPPADARIAAHIAAVESVAQVPRHRDPAASARGSIEHLGPEVARAYVERALTTVPPGPRDLRIVLTPLHGVGVPLALEVLERAGFTDVTVVARQGQPDPDFPTVDFPNPEEPGALDLAIETAEDVGADLIIANDPDADRCSVAVPGVGAEGGWRQLSGDEAGALLGEQAAATATAGPGADTAVLASSVVSSRLLAAIAHSHGLPYRATLTGFKWISRVPDLVFGYEEAIGYCVDPQGVRDKDGITAALHLAALAARAKDAGATLMDSLDELARRHGLHATAPLSVRVADLALISAILASLRADPPTHLGGSAVVQVRDLNAGGDLPPTDALMYLTEAGDRVIVRPSGTEPKLKCYLEVVLPLDDQDLTRVRHRAADRLAALSADIGSRLRA
ncbi:phospho-sugar mutase [Pseudactinotalea sp. Z1732]|uniref:phospho-sugar mutase n=1 Tax=Pseudactinotalea sp. Z1732 TaxID=3413026 RepID=UPI003C7BFF02